MLLKSSHPLRAIVPPSILAKPVIYVDHQEIDREIVEYLIHQLEVDIRTSQESLVI